MKTRRLAPVLLIASSCAAAQISALKSPAIREIHSKHLTPSSDTLFIAESQAPASASAWASLEKSAQSLAKAARDLSEVPAAKDMVHWRAFSGNLAMHARTAARAAQSRDLNALVAADGEIIATCEACHDEYRDAGHGMTSDKK